MKRIIIIFVLLFIVFLTAMFTIPIFFKEDIYSAINRKINENIYAKVYMNEDEFNVSLLKSFPDLQVGLGNFGIIGKGIFEGDTLLHVENFALELDLFSLLTGDAIILKGFILNKPNINIKIKKGGEANYDLFPEESLKEKENSQEKINSSQNLTYQENKKQIENSKSQQLEKNQAERKQIENQKTKEFSQQKDETNSESTLSIQLKSWKVKHARIIYNDEELGMYLSINDFNQNGNGDFTLDNYDLETNSTAKAVTFLFEEISYLSNDKLDADIKINIDMPTWTFTFKENYIKINEFGLSTEGYFKMPEQGYEMDISFASKENQFKNILSLVPNEFLKEYENLNAEGNVVFNGWVKGIYDDEKEMMPGYKINLQIKDGMFQYPELPTSINNIQVDMIVDGSEGIIDNTIIDIEQFSMKLGTYPINGKLRIAGLTDYQIDTDINAKVDLSTIPHIFRIDSITLKGIFEIHAKANGIYSEAKGIIPKIDAYMKLEQGYIKHEAYLLPVENIHLKSSIKNTNDKLADTKIIIETLGVNVGKDKIESSGLIYQLDDPNYRFKLNGSFDFANVEKIYPLEEMTLSGKVFFDINTKGSMSAIEEEKYEQLSTNGNLKLSDFKLEMDSFPDCTIDRAKFTFTPKNIVLEEYKGKVGKSDMYLKGQLTNYLAYILKDETLKGKFNLYSNYLDINEWMPEEETDNSGKKTSAIPKNKLHTPTYTSNIRNRKITQVSYLTKVSNTSITEDEAIVSIPKNISLILDANIKKIDVIDMVITNLKGFIKVKNGILALNDTYFDLLEGKFKTTGSYNTEKPEKPSFDFNMEIKKLSFKKTYQTFNSVKKFAPIAKNITGTFDGQIAIRGDIGKDYEPIYETLLGNGSIYIANAGLKDNKALDLVADFTKSKDFKDPTFNDVNISFEIKDGKLYVEPFDVKINDIKANISGSNTFAGEMDYLLKTTIPASKLGGNLASQYANIIGQTTIPVNLYITGTYEKPQIRFTKPKNTQTKKKSEEEGEKLKEKGKEIITDLLKDTTSKEKIEKTIDGVKDAFKGLFKGKKKN